MIRTYPPYQNASFPVMLLNKICPDAHCGSVPSSTASPCLWLTPALRGREGKPGICYPLLSSSCYFTSLWQRPMQLSFMSLWRDIKPGRNRPPSHQKSLSLFRCLWAEPAAHPSHLLPSLLRPLFPDAVSSTHTGAAFPSISQPFRPALSAFLMVPLPLTLCIAHQL